MGEVRRAAAGLTAELRTDIARLSAQLAQANKELYAAKQLAATQADVTVKDGEASSVSNLEPDVTDVHALWQPSIDDAAKFRDRITPFAWTPVWAAPTKGFSIRKLKKYLLKVRKTNKGKIKSNDGGFHSDGDLIDSAKALNNPLLKSLRDEINRHIHSYLRSLAKSTEQVGGPGLKKYRITLGDTWYNINGKGHYNNVHTHDGSHISGVLYVDDGGDETACTQFYDVRGQRAELASLLDTHLGDLFRPVWAGTNSPTSICPKNGYMVLFPSWLPHSVHALATDGVRISISFNAVLEDRPQGSRKEILEPGDRDWPSQLSESVDMATGLELAGGAAAVPMWGRSVSSTRWGGYPEPDGSSLRLHWPTPIRPIVLHELAGSVEAMRRMVHKLEKSDSEGQENVVRRGRSGWAWHAAGHGAGILDHRSEAASDLRDAYYQQIYWYVYEMLNLGRKRAQGTQGDNERVDMAVEIIDSSAHILRQGELLLQQARGDAEVCGFAALDLGLKMSGKGDRNDLEIVDPRPMYSGTSAAYRGAKTASQYYWEMTNLGGRKISFGLVPGLVMLWPCWLKYDVVPQSSEVGSRSFITFAAKVKISLQSRPTTTDTASGVFKQHSALPLLRVPKKHQLTTEGGGLDSQ